MSRRIDVELTSTRGDGTWTWRAAGALKPKGVVDEKLLYEGARVGDVVRAEAEFDIDGIVITSVAPPKSRQSESDHLELIGPERDFNPVTTALVPKRDRPAGERRERDGGRGRTGDRGERAEHGGRHRGDAPGREREGQPRDRGERSPRPEGAGRFDRPARGGSPARTGPAARGERTPQAGRPARPPRTDVAEGRPDRSAPPDRPRPKRLNPANVHRAAALEKLAPEQRPIAEQILRGGIPAVRRAVEEQNARTRAEGQPEIKGGPLLAIAEELLPRLRAAEWRDKAEAAAADAEEIALRDLRSVVAGSDAAGRDDESRLLASTLREVLERRIARLRDEWLGEITSSLDDGRLVRALRVSSHPPDPSMRCPADLARRLSDTASAAMAPDAPPDRWVALLEAVGASPVRRSVKPAGLPPEPGEPLLHAARQASGRVPALAALLGIDMPPPPGPARPPRPGPRGGPTGRASGPGRPPLPPRPPARPAAVPAPGAAPAVPAPAVAPAPAVPAPAVAPAPAGPGPAAEPAPAAAAAPAAPGPAGPAGPPAPGEPAVPAPGPAATAAPVAPEPPPGPAVAPGPAPAVEASPAVEPAPTPAVDAAPERG